MRNWRTTLIGAALAAVSAIALYQQSGGDLSDWKQYAIPVLLAFLGYLAKDAGVTGSVKLLVACLCLLSLPACELMKTPQSKQLVVSLVEIGLKAAVEHGKLDAGDALSIGNGVAVVTSGDTTLSKVVKLSDIGLNTAVSKGIVKPGDAVLIQEASAVITQSLPSQP